MITVSNVSLTFGGQKLFSGADLKFMPGNCYGVIGANGAGKSTFLRILSGELEPTTGTVTIPAGQRLSTLKQDQFKYDAYPVLDTVIMGNQRLYDIMKEKDELYAKPDFSDADGERAAELEGEFAEMDGWNAASDAAPLLTVTNLGRSGGFSGEIAHALFTDKTAQDALFENIFSVLRMKNYYGVNFNIEYVYPYDRDSYSQFLCRAADELHPRGYFLSTAIAPKESAGQEGLLYTAHDYAAHGRYADRVIIMTYEWGYTYSAPQAVSPVNRMRRVLEYAVGEIPPGKILMGFSNYGYSWRLPWRQGDAATVISNAAAMNLAASAGAEIKFDRTAQAPFFTYTDAAGVRRVVWFEDARSVRARLELVNEYGLAGISYWTVNQLYRPGLELLQGMFDAEKVI